MPLPSVKSPPCSMKLGMTRWKMLPLLLRSANTGEEEVKHKVGYRGDNRENRALWALRAREAGTDKRQTH